MPPAPAQEAAALGHAHSPLRPRRNAVVATVIGNALEWFDFAAYGFMAAIIAARFFPGGDDLLSLMSAFAVFGVGFIARPLGALAFGRLGDQRGRKLALLISMPLMGLGTLIVGISPDYETIGVLAPALLVVGRLMQGFSAGGEVGNAMAFLLEWAPRNQRALYSSLQQSSAIMGTLLGSGCAALITSLLSPEDVAAWGWRLPFLFGGLVIAPLGLFLRAHVDETPVFATRSRADAAPASPVADVRSPWLLGARSVALCAAWVVAFYLYLIYLASFLPQHGGVAPAVALWANTAGLATMMVTIPLAGALSDRIGRKPPILAAAILSLIAPYPVFVMLSDAPSAAQVYLVMVGAGLLAGTFAGIVPAMLSESFPTAVRTTGVSTSFALATAVFGGFAPFIATWLISATGSPVAPAAYAIAAAAASLLALATQRETAFENLT